MKQEIFPIVAQLLEDRYEMGKKKYGVPLMAFNGRDALQDAIEEAADLLMYLSQAKYERDHSSLPSSGPNESSMQSGGTSSNPIS